jgi:pimeloyl-ACP methyl ester carboxylesterase
VVFFHGFTNCPAQLDELAPQLFALGYNVYVPLLPRHGEADQMTLALADLTAEEIVESADEAIDLARGLGEHVAVVGLSGGGTMAAWSAQYRADADSTIAIAPFLGPHILPFWANSAATNLLLLLPNLMIPWDPKQPQGPPAMDYAYPRYATHALAQFMRLGDILGASARDKPPLAPGLGMLLNEADDAVSNTLAQRLIASWHRHGREVDLEVLPESLGLIHDLIDPRQIEANTDLVYPVLIDMIKRQSVPGTGE